LASRGDEICPLGGLFTISFTPRGEHSLIFKRMKGQTVGLYPWGITSPPMWDNFTMEANFTLGANFTPGGHILPLGEVKNWPQPLSRSRKHGSKMSQIQHYRTLPLDWTPLTFLVICFLWMNTITMRIKLWKRTLLLYKYLKPYTPGFEQGQRAVKSRSKYSQ
jgi:hypothetical protein